MLIVVAETHPAWSPPTLYDLIVFSLSSKTVDGMSRATLF